jgi:hypothetical protein
MKIRAVGRDLFYVEWYAAWQTWLQLRVIFSNFANAAMNETRKQGFVANDSNHVTKFNQLVAWNNKFALKCKINIWNSSECRKVNDDLGISYVNYIKQRDFPLLVLVWIIYQCTFADVWGDIDRSIMVISPFCIWQPLCIYLVHQLPFFICIHRCRTDAHPSCSNRHPVERT